MQFGGELSTYIGGKTRGNIHMELFCGMSSFRKKHSPYLLIGVTFVTNLLS